MIRNVDGSPDMIEDWNLVLCHHLRSKPRARLAPNVVAVGQEQEMERGNNDGLLSRSFQGSQTFRKGRVKNARWRMNTPCAKLLFPQPIDRE